MFAGELALTTSADAADRQVAAAWQDIQQR
jgi:hypothetical protein